MAHSRPPLHNRRRHYPAIGRRPGISPHNLAVARMGLEDRRILGLRDPQLGPMPTPAFVIFVSFLCFRLRQGFGGPP
jgi:hypothetical protein